MQLRFAPRADGHNNAPPCVKTVTRFDVVERDLFLTVEAGSVVPQFERQSRGIMIAAYTRVRETPHMGVADLVTLERFRPLEVMPHLERLRYEIVGRSLGPFGFLGVGLFHHVR